MTEEEIAAIAAQLRRLPEGFRWALDEAEFPVGDGKTVRVWICAPRGKVEIFGFGVAPSAALKAALDAAGVPE